ncbi:MAG: hypothetical protein IJ551_01480 [Prevotella sp.]|nr:hypothetical protein [Prevotella sp.]
MENVRKWYLLALMLVAALTFSACGDDDEEGGGQQQTGFVGEWICKAYNGGMNLTMYKDGTYWYRDNYYSREGNWYHNNSLQTLSLTNWDSYGGTRTYFVLALTDSYFIIMNDDGDSYTYERKTGDEDEEPDYQSDYLGPSDEVFQMMLGTWEIVEHNRLYADGSVYQISSNIGKWMTFYDEVSSNNSGPGQYKYSYDGSSWSSIADKEFYWSIYTGYGTNRLQTWAGGPFGDIVSINDWSFTVYYYDESDQSALVWECRKVY